MKRVYLYIVFGAFLLTAQLWAQNTRGLKSKYNTEKYPEISFVWNSANPDVLDKSQFVLTDEDNQPIDFNFKVLSKGNVNQNKSILFLWEDMVSHSKQTEFTRQLLSRFFNETLLNDSDMFNVAVFNRKKSSKRTVTEPLLKSFSSDSRQLKDTVYSYTRSSEFFKEFSQQSDLYLAINEGIELLKKEPSNRTCILIVVTAGLNVKAAGASTEMESVRKNALDADIPIYVVKYPLAGDAPEVNSLSESTYGLHASSCDVNEALAVLRNYYYNFDSRCYGNDYEITFTTKAKRDGKPHRIGLTVNKVPQLLAAFNAPDMTFCDWIEENTALFIVFVVIFIAIVIFSVWFIRRSIAERNKKNEILQKGIDQSNEQLEELKRQQEEEKRRIAAEAAEKERAEKEKRLTNLMQTKNLFPHLQCKIPDTSFTYTINNIHTTLGRNENNDVVLNNKTVSGFHAEITFNGTAFDITNKSKSYTQGVIVNGQFFQQCTLKSGDIIGLGEALIIFYV